MQAEYSRLAGVYDRRWSRYIAISVREAIRRLPLKAGARVLDVGCGTGVLLSDLARSGNPLRLTGADPSPEMLGIARHRLAGAADLRGGQAEALPFEGTSFDALVSSSVLHLLSDLRAAAREFKRVLVPGGTFVIIDWCGDDLSCRLCTLYLRIVRGTKVRAHRMTKLCRAFEQEGLLVSSADRFNVNWLWRLMAIAGRKP